MPHFPDWRDDDRNSPNVGFQRPRVWWPGVFAWFIVIAFLTGFWTLVYLAVRRWWPHGGG